MHPHQSTPTQPNMLNFTWYSATHTYIPSLTSPLIKGITPRGLVSCTTETEHKHISLSLIYTYTTSTHVHTDTQTHVHTYIQTHVHTYIQTHEYTYIQTHVHTDTCTHVHTDTRTHRYTLGVGKGMWSERVVPARHTHAPFRPPVYICTDS